MNYHLYPSTNGPLVGFSAPGSATNPEPAGVRGFNWVASSSDYVICSMAFASKTSATPSSFMTYFD